ncbi:elongator complex protein 3 [Acetivibrio straminisolvens]|jgi:radical SAM enzyme (TIGR01210 family)|uniref:elongator complex protein 3 n=1 Tax=Acetivibrio straminisolvens TaxID=253314 RepID=UPI00223F7274|nr:radical SAM protein [Acetivibrio straminisolvens]
MAFKHIVIPIFIPHKGCPFDCIYCNQKYISGQKDDMTEDKMISIIESHINSAGQDAYIEIGFYGGSFTGIEREEQYKYLETANRYIKEGKVKSIRLSTRPDYITGEILDYLKKYSVNTIELGVQSLDDEVLQKTCRGHSAEDVYNASALIKKWGFVLGIQTMIGLPGDSRQKALHTAEKVVGIKPDILRIYPTLVVRGTYLEKMYNKGEYTPLELEEAVELCAELLYIYEKNNINVIRIGLQPTESINEGGDVIAGPFHPAFRQLVESRMALDVIEKAIIEQNLSKKSSLIICTDKKEISNVIGQGRKNVEYLRKKYGYDKIIVREYNVGHEIYDIKY